MAKTIMDLFKDKKKDLYGTSGNVFIESRGLINPARAAALAVSSPVQAADFVGSQINGFTGGSAKRPSDTIFKNKTALSKPITLLTPTQELLRDSVKADTPYYIKTSPTPGANLAKDIVKVASNPAQLVSMGSMALNKFGSKGAVKRLQDLLKIKGDPGGYGSRFGMKERDESKTDDKKIVKYSQNYTVFNYDQNSAKYSRKIGENKASYIAERKNTAISDGKSKFDTINDWVLSNLTIDIPDDTAAENRDKAVLDKTGIKGAEYAGYTFVRIKLYGKSDTIILPGTITGLSEDFAPVVNSFKYVGSPFSLYRYGGVERSIKFNLKLYSIEPKHEASLRLNLDKLRSLVYPDENIAVVKYADTAYSPMYFTPNLVEMSISGLYNNVFGIVDSLGITVQDNIPWASSDFLSADNSKANQHPVVFDVSFGMKVIERVSVTEKDGKAKYNFGQSKEENNKYVNYFTGYNYFGEDKFSNVAASKDASKTVIKDNE